MREQTDNNAAISGLLRQIREQVVYQRERDCWNRSVRSGSVILRSFRWKAARFDAANGDRQPDAPTTSG